jgi:hypothetical protein
MSAPALKILPTLMFLAVTCVIVWVLQVALEPADKKAFALCLPPYKIAHFSMVTIPHWVAPEDAELVIRNAVRAANFNRACVDAGNKAFNSGGSHP